MRSGPGVLLALAVSFAVFSFFGSVVLLTVAMMIGVPHPQRHVQQPQQELVLAASGMILVAVLMIYAQIGAGMWWVHRLWSWLPPEQRYTRHWKSWISPGTAVGFLFIPYFHYYWMFVINCGICDALDRLRVAYPTKHAAPKGLAIAAGICQFVIPLPVGSLLWLLFVRRVDAMTREMAATSRYQMHAARSPVQGFAR